MSRTMVTAIALSCWTPCLGQEAIVVNPTTIHLQSASSRSVQVDLLPGPSINTSGRVVLPSGYVHLGDDVLNCEECRRRLGLPPLAMSTGIIPQDRLSDAGPKLSGAVQSNTSAQSSFHTQTQTPTRVVPQASVGLSGLPLEARQQLLQGLSLPEGATILSAKFIDPPVKPVEKPVEKPAEKPAVESSSKVGLQAAINLEPSAPAPQVPRIAVPIPTDSSTSAVSKPVIIEAKVDPSNSIETSQTTPEALPAITAVPLDPPMKAMAKESAVLSPSEGLSSTDRKDATQEVELPVQEVKAVEQEANESASLPPMLEAPKDLEKTTEKIEVPNEVASVATSIATTEVTGEVSNEAIRSEAVANRMPATLEPSVPEPAPISNVTSQKSADSERARPAMNIAPDANALVVDGVLRSPALQQIQIDFLKKQLAERDDLIRQINSMQPAFQEQIDELARGNDQLRKREQELARENQQIRIKTQQESQKHDVKLVEIKAELFAVQQQLRDQEMSFNDKMEDADKANFSELVKLRKELSEIQKDKAAAVSTLRQEIEALTDSHSKQTSQQLTEQQRIVDAHLKSIDNLERQLESVRASQAMDLRKIESIRDQQKAEREAKQIQAEPAPSSPFPSPAPVPSTLIEPGTQSKETEIDKGTFKPFELPAPDIKATKLKIPRIENQKPAAETTKSF